METAGKKRLTALFANDVPISLYGEQQGLFSADFTERTRKEVFALLDALARQKKQENGGEIVAVQEVVSYSAATTLKFFSRKGDDKALLERWHQEVFGDQFARSAFSKPLYGDWQSLFAYPPEVNPFNRLWER